jgi:hypothetical protein
MQRNPRISNIPADAEPNALPRVACVKRYVDELRPGDRVVLWVSGSRAGVYALGEVADDRGSPIARSGDVEANEPFALAGQVPLNVLVDLRARPLLRTLLKLDPRFARESIIRQPFAANPHRVSAPAFEAIIEHAGFSC